MTAEPPSTWSVKKIAELADGPDGLFADGDWIESKDQSPHGTVRLLQVGNVLRGRMKLDGSKRWVTEATAEHLRCTRLREGDILVARMPDPIGRACLVPPLPYPAITAVDCAIIRPTSGVTREYLVQFLNWGEQLSRVLVHTTGTTRTRISRNNLGAMEVPIPPIPEQRKIAAILSSVDEVIEKTESVIEQLQVVKKAMMQELLTRGIPGRHTRFKQTEIGEIPEEWEVVTLADLANGADGLQTGPFGSQLKASEYTEKGIPVVMPKDLDMLRVSTETVARVPEARASELKRHRIVSGDILLGRRGDIGRAGLITERESGWLCGTGCLRARIRMDRVLPRFLIHLIDSQRPRSWLLEHAVGQTMLNLNTKILGNLPIQLPSIKEQERVANFADQAEWRLSAERSTLKELGSVKSALMSVLLTGELRVTPDEPSA